MKNEIIQKKGYVEVKCKYKGEEYRVLMDNEDVNRFDGFEGTLSLMETHGKMYSYVIHKRNKLLAHRFILNAGKGQEVTFLDGNSLNLRRANIDFASRSRINRNKRLQSNNESGCHGVTWNKRDNKWVVRIYCGGKSTYIGAWSDKTQAIKERRKAEKKYYSGD